jgi:hypothetical protein
MLHLRVAVAPFRQRRQAGSKSQAARRLAAPTASESLDVDAAAFVIETLCLAAAASVSAHLVRRRVLRPQQRRWRCCAYAKFP